MAIGSGPIGGAPIGGVPPGQLTFYTLSVDAGSYSITGTAASLEYGRVIAAAAGSYAITGSAATLRKNIPLTADAGSYAISGTAASLEYGRLIAAGAGSYAITGTATSLEYGYVLGASPGSYAITGTAADLVYTQAGVYALAVDSGAYAITGTPASLEFGYFLSAEPGSYEITGSDVALTYVPVAAGVLPEQPSGAGSGGHSTTWSVKGPALIAPFIKWGKKKKDKQAQIAEVAAVIKQTVAKADAPYIDPTERDLIAARLLETENLAQLRRILTIADMLARIERELGEMDDEEAILLLM